MDASINLLGIKLKTSLDLSGVKFGVSEESIQQQHWDLILIGIEVAKITVLIHVIDITAPIITGKTVLMLPLESSLTQAKFLELV